MNLPPGHIIQQNDYQFCEEQKDIFFNGVGRHGLGYRKNAYGVEKYSISSTDIFYPPKYHNIISDLRLYISDQNMHQFKFSRDQSQVFFTFAKFAAACRVKY